MCGPFTGKLSFMSTLLIILTLKKTTTCVLLLGRRLLIQMKNLSLKKKRRSASRQRRSSTLGSSLSCRRARRLSRSHRWSLPPLQTPAVGGSDGCREGVEDQHKAGSESGGTSRRTSAEPDVPSAGVKVTLPSEGCNSAEENGFPAVGLDVLLQL